MEARTAALVCFGVAVAMQAVPHPNVISGTVTAPDGKPVAGAVVTVVERSTRSGMQVFHPVDARAHVTTDEHGAYRLENAPLGEYFVVAIPHNPTLTPERRINRSGYRITYYPSAKTAADAMPVTVNMHAPVVADIRLLSAALSVVSGTVIGQNGQPVRGGKLNIAHGDNLFGLDSMVMNTRADGTFMLPPLPPGTYFLAYHESAWPPRGEVPLISHEKIVVDGQDLAGVRVAPIHQVPVRGRVVVPDADRPRFQRSQFEVTVAPSPWDGNPGPISGDRVRDDFTFEFKAWPQPSTMRVLIYQNGWRVKRVLRDGVDITDKPIDIREGHEVTGIVIELAPA